MLVNPGELNKRIKISTQNGGKDSDGLLLEGLTDLHECWAKVSNTSGTEAAKSGAKYADLNTRFLIRYTAKDIATDCVVTFNDCRYDIEYINNYGYSNEYIEIFAKATTPARR